MTTETFSVAIVPSNTAWRSLLWFVPLTALWILLIYRRPAIPASGVPTSAHQLMAHGLIAVGLWLGLESTDLTPRPTPHDLAGDHASRTLFGSLSPGARRSMASFITGASPLPVLPLAIFLPVIIGAPLLLLSKRVGQVLDAMPASWLVALQLYRVFGSWALAAWLRGALPGVFALPAGIGDVLTGLFAVPAAIAVATGTAQGRRAAMIWNIFGLADFAVAITLGDDHLARPLPADRSGFAEHRRRRLSGCADPCFRGAKLDPAARAVAAPAAPAQPGGDGAALDPRRVEAGRCQYSGGGRCSAGGAKRRLRAPSPSSPGGSENRACARSSAHRRSASGGPCSTMRPVSKTATQSPTRRANVISCVTTTMVIPSSASFFITLSTSPIVSGSSADVGSSNSMTSGSIASARAIATRCCWPPDSADG